MNVEAGIGQTINRTVNCLDLLCNDVQSETHIPEDAPGILKRIRIKNVNNLIIATLNINSLANKFEPLRTIIGNNLDS